MEMFYNLGASFLKLQEIQVNSCDIYTVLYLYGLNQTNVQYWATIGPRAKRSSNGISLASRLLPAFRYLLGCICGTILLRTD